jgi:CRISPR/Cas system-associated endonuclease Cas1
LRVDGGALVVVNGRTHLGHTSDTYRYFKGDLHLPPRITLLGGSGGITFDVLDWLGDQGIPLVRVDADGKVLSTVGGYGFAAERAKVHWQECTRSDLARRMAFSIQLIKDKLAASIETLETAFEPAKARDAAIAKARAGIETLTKSPPKDMEGLRSIEANSAVAYFAA